MRKFLIEEPHLNAIIEAMQKLPISQLPVFNEIKAALEKGLKIIKEDTEENKEKSE